MLSEPEFASVEARVRLLRSMPDLADVEVDSLLLMAEASRFRRFRPGAVIWRETAPVTSVHYVLEGRVRVEREGRLLGIVEGRRALGFTALLTDGEELTATVETWTTALEIAGEAVRVALERDVGLQRLVLRGLARAWLLERGPLPRGDGSTEERRCDAPLGVVERVLELRRSPLLRANVDALAELATSATELHVAPGDSLWERGDRATHGVRIVSGEVECEGADGARTTVGAGTDLGFIEALAELPRPFGARASVSLIALSIERVDWFTVLEVHPRFAAEVTAFLVRQIR